MKDLSTGNITLASTSDTGVKGNSGSWRSAISSDGTRVAFDSGATNLDPADTEPDGDIYVKELGGAPPPSADLSLTKSDSPDPVTVGDTLTYTLTVANGGPDAAADATVIDNLPGSVTFASATPSQGSCLESGGTVACNLGAIANGAGATVTIEVTPNSAGTITDTASVSSATADPQSANNSDSEDTTVQPLSGAQADLSIRKSDSKDPVRVGGRLRYNLTVRNLGPDTATGVMVTDQLPGGVTFVSAGSRQGACTEAGGVVTCNLGSLPAGGRASRASATIQVRPTAAGVITNSADATANEADPNPANNHDSETTTVQ